MHLIIYKRQCNEFNLLSIGFVYYQTLCFGGYVKKRRADTATFGKIFLRNFLIPCTYILLNNYAKNCQANLLQNPEMRAGILKCYWNWWSIFLHVLVKS